MCVFALILVYSFVYFIYLFIYILTLVVVGCSFSATCRVCKYFHVFLRMMQLLFRAMGERKFTQDARAMA